jgi:hypothetical protein
VDVQSRARLVVDGKTETAVGEVGGHIRLQGGDPVDGDVTASMNEWWGYWQMNEGWRLQAGRWDNTAAVQSGPDWDCTLCGYSQGGKGMFYNSIGVTNGGTEQIRLIYTGGPFTWAVAVEDPVGSPAGEADIPDFASYVQWNGDGIMMMASGVWADDPFDDADDDWFVGAGARFGLGEIAALSLAGGFGEGYSRNSILTLDTSDTEYWGVSALLTFNVAEASRIEIWGGWSEADNDGGIGFFSPDEKWLVGAGWFWDPVSQLTLGIQADYSQIGFTSDDPALDDHDDDQINVAFGTWFRF